MRWQWLFILALAVFWVSPVRCEPPSITTVDEANQTLTWALDAHQRVMSQWGTGHPGILFGACQECILKALKQVAAEGGLSRPDTIWLGNVVKEFMGSFINASNQHRYELPSGRRIRTDDPAFQSMLRGESSGHWWTRFEQTSQSPFLKLVGNLFYPEVFYAFLMAQMHIEGDLRMSLLKHGYGSDEVWARIGRVVNECKDSTLRDLKAGGRFRLVPRPQSYLNRVAEVLAGFRTDWIRDHMRRQVIATMKRRGGGPYQGVRISVNDFHFGTHGACGALFKMMRVVPYPR